jgi:CRP-like cAMP-binding protein
MPVDGEVLRRIPYFAPLHPEELTRVAAVTVKRHYKRGDMIILEGDLSGALYYVHAGLVKLFKTSLEGKEQVLKLIAEGHTFNDVPALDGGPNPASAAAMEPSVVYVIRHADLHTLIVTQPAVAEAVVQALTQALRSLVSLVEDLSLRHVIARVAKMLLDQEAAVQGELHGYRLTQQEMAALAGTAREVVGRALKELETAGAIQMDQGQARVVNRERLRYYAHFRERKSRSKP